MDIACFILPQFVLHSFKKGYESQWHPWKEGRAVPGELVCPWVYSYLDGKVCYPQGAGDIETL